MHVSVSLVCIRRVCFPMGLGFHLCGGVVFLVGFVFIYLFGVCFWLGFLFVFCVCLGFFFPTKQKSAWLLLKLWHNTSGDVVTDNFAICFPYFLQLGWSLLKTALASEGFLLLCFVITWLCMLLVCSYLYIIFVLWNVVLGLFRVDRMVLICGQENIHEGLWDWIKKKW